MLLASISDFTVWCYTRSTVMDRLKNLQSDGRDGGMCLSCMKHMGA